MLSKEFLLLYSMPILVAIIIFGNHYARDTVGALEKQMESDLHITPGQYSTLNSIFFIPNIFVPLFMGFLCEFFGGPAKLLIYAVLLATIGHLLFALGAEISSLPLFYLGRSIAGLVYEVMDAVPINFLGLLFKHEWGFISGMINGFLRLGSVFCFLLNPYFYSKYGVTAALWAAGMISLTGVFAAVCAFVTQRMYYSNLTQHTDNEDSVVNTTEYNLVRQDNSDSNGSSPLSNENGTNYSDKYTSKQSVTWYSSLVISCVKYMPVHEFGLQYHFFALSSCCLYGAMVPFWFIGSKFIQINYNMSVGRADTLMLLPEGVIVVISPIAGYLMDAYKLSLKWKLIFLAVSCVSLAVSYLFLAFGYDTSHADSANQYRTVVSPLFTMSLLGVSYAFSNSLLWTSFVLVIQDKHLASASGLVASAMNVLPSVVPHLILYLEWLSVTRYRGNRTVTGTSNVGLYVLTVMALLSGLCAYLSSLCVNHTEWARAHLAGSQNCMKNDYDLNNQSDKTNVTPTKSTLSKNSNSTRSPLSALATNTVCITADGSESGDIELAAMCDSDV